MVQNLAISIPSITIADAEDIVDAFKEIPLTALSPNTRFQLSNLLNSRKYLRSEGGYCRDWRGIATLTHQIDFFDESAISGSDPTSKVIDQWSKLKPNEATFANLRQILGDIDRWDASDDIYENLVEDAKNYKTKQRNKQTLPSRSTVSEQSIEEPVDSEMETLTLDDAMLAEQNLPPQIYDAFVLYVDVDAEYAVEIRKHLEEDQKNNLKLCFKDNLLPGKTFLHTALTKLIEKRCNRLIVIYTKEFRKSPENEFLVSFALGVQINNRYGDKRKIIPLVYEDDVVLPSELQFLTKMNYNAYNFWNRLAASVRSISITPETISSSIKDNKQSANIRLQPDLTNLPSPPVEIPSINITLAQDEDDEPPSIKEMRNFKKHPNAATLRNSNPSGINTINGNHHNENFSSKLMRHAHSTSQLNGKNYKENNVSSSDISITSNCSDTRKKKKKKWSTKFLKRVFSRSSTKLQTAV